MPGYSTYFISGALAYLDGLLPLLPLYRRERTSTPGGSATLDVLEEHEQRTNSNSCNTLQFKCSNDRVLTGGNHLQEQRVIRGGLNRTLLVVSYGDTLCRHTVYVGASFHIWYGCPWGSRRSADDTAVMRR